MPKTPPPLVLSALLSLAGAMSAQDAGVESVRYGRDIRPILSDRCFKCHGPDAATREADLRLDVRDEAIAVGDDGAAIVPGDPDASLLWQRIRSHDDDERMPPPSSQKPRLSDAEAQLLRRWIAAGAVYEDHWAFVPPRKAAPPAGAGHPVDAFLRDAQRARGLEASPRADAATLCRRVHLVLTGLPPTPEELDAFVSDARPDAYERLVDRLLGEDPYQTRHAEHLASIWLDAGRYADTSGIHMDAGRQAWLWRDWLIEALKTDKPFDEFVVEQLAGDLLPDATPWQKVATGFLRNHVTTDEGGAIDAEYLVEYAAERANTVGSVFLGMTVGCARCHDHKYDPLSQEDYYRLFSFFYNNEEPGLYSQARDANRALEPFLPVPSDAQERRREKLTAQIAAAEASLALTTPAEQRGFRDLLAGVEARFGLAWHRPIVTAATSEGGATMAVQLDGTVLASGANPPRDTHTLLLHSDATDQRWLCLEALADESLPEGKVGRSANGNAVLQHVRLEARPAGAADDAAWTDVRLVFALADVEQQNGDFVVGNVLDDDDRGWAIGAHLQPASSRAALLLAEAPFGFPGGTELRLTLKYDTIYAEHVFGRVRLSTSPADAASLAALPAAHSGFHVVGPFDSGREDPYATAFGPEQSTAIDRTARWNELAWRYEPDFAVGKVFPLKNVPGSTYLAQRLWLPSPRRVEFALGSDDGFQLYVDGQKVGERRVDRAVARDQDRVAVELSAGPHLAVLKVVNTGGAAGFAMEPLGAEGELPHDLALVLLPAEARAGRIADRITAAYQNAYSPEHRARMADLAALREQQKALEAAVPRAMVMKEREQPRPAFVLMRGEYDKPDTSRPAARELPAMFGALPQGAPKNRLGFARWLVSEGNPLLLRVTANRLWEFVFGTGIVRTSEDFGLQGEWPSHPELLDWLAVELRDNGHSVRKLLRLLVTSEAFCQQSRRGPAAAVDPDDRLLTWFPRRRLSAETIRDQALYLGGLLVEQVGGPSVKPYQPPGLWREVAMVQSNTRTFERGDGDALWRRSLYTYWKRACPPPSLSTFDAPTREFCTIRRSVTNTPLQALVLWNDEQFVEAARVLAQRTMREHANDADRLAAMHRRATGHALVGRAADEALATLHDLVRRYGQEPTAAEALLAVGDARRDTTLPPAQLAAFTLLASAFLDLDATVYLD